MEMHQLRYFVAVAETGTFSRAARRCYVSQPSLSQQIIKLEQDLGLPLFDRTGRQAVPTEAGEVLLERARQILATADDAERELRDLRQDGPHHLSVGVIPTLAPFLLPDVLVEFARTRANLVLDLREDTTARLVDALLVGELDLAVASLPIDAARIETEVLGNEPLRAAVPEGHPLADRLRVSLVELREEPFLLMHDTHCLSGQVVHFCQQRDFIPRVVCRGAQLETIRALVGRGLGVSLLPALACRPVPGVVYVDLEETHVARPVAALWVGRRHRPRTAQAVVETVRMALARREGERLAVSGR